MRDMGTRRDIGRVGSEEELTQLGAILGWAFGSPEPKATQWLRRGGVDNVKVARESGRVIGGLLEIPMGQWFSGRSVPMLGIAGVAVALDARGRGVALALMQASLRAARERGFALSVLYPATHTLYRALGYELAGGYYSYSMAAKDCPREKSGLRAMLSSADDAPALTALYDEIARERSGYLDRNAYIWARVREPHEERALGIVARGEHGIDGYAYMNQGPSKSGDYDLILSDLVARNPRALQQLLGFFANQRSTLGNIVWRASVADAALLAFNEQVFTPTIDRYWMLRLLDVGRALELRGYPELDAEITLEVEDELFPENAGAYQLTVERGRPSVSRGGNAGVRLDVRSLAALYSGFLSAEELRRAGALSADGATLRTLSSVFSGTPPAMADYF